MNVILVDIQGEKMETLADQLESTYEIETGRLVLDLAGREAVERCMDAIKETGCRLLIYNAAFSRVKPFLAAGEDELNQYVDVNARTPIRLVHAFTGWLRSENRKGGVLLMSSLAGLWGTKLVAAYSGTKAFNLALAEALHHEFKPFGIMVSACCAGATATPGYLGTHPEYGFIRPNVMKPETVAEIALDQLGKKTIIIPGLTNRMTYFFMTRILPRSWASWIINRTMEQNYRIEH